ncbi:unnamed protein product [Kluyveromyces dobzhanskii CBS 2104]|uniref:WGS project CCBQ000000000 data, contig 00008 n=1 Tax=Kluyveromyces dobzhanskii CBS 2104 TaxID=1427455 RepID=A0A0A8L9R5_9SACH|nr:unnamed protein product [Kluyveromyces dobzhanskii CBS 2104]
MPGLLAIIQDFFSLETLDQRLAAPASNDSRRKQKLGPELQSRKSTLEFKAYWVILIVVLPLMLKGGMDATNSWNPNYYKYQHMLSNGWMFGRKVDNSDAQYRFFRDNLVLLVGLMGIHLAIKKSVLRFTNVQKVAFDFWFGMIFLVGAHGVNSLRVLFHILIMFVIAKAFKRQRTLATVIIWTYGIGSLFINNSYRNLQFGQMLPILKPLDRSFKGIIERWDVFYNFTLLRMISFDMDFLERWNRIHSNPTSTPSSNCVSPERFEIKRASSTQILETIEENASKSTLLDERGRLTAPHHIQEYSLMPYLAYITYTPLFIAGPILTFNDYLYQSYYQLPSISSKRSFKYALRLLFCLFTMEFLLHFVYVVAVSKAKAWAGDTPFQISMIGLFNLNLIWLKLLIPWRLFRLWALLDGIDPPENMIRCMNNNFSPVAFWRAWHRSYNKWVIRYIYIPLGGSGNRILTSFAVFSFVAIWHDIELKLLLWGWLVVLFLLPEILLSRYFNQFNKKPWYRHVCACGAVLNIWMMMIANLFGFCLGPDGILLFFKEMFGTFDGLLYFIVANCALFVGVQLMFEFRAIEMRKGINVKC